MTALQFAPILPQHAIERCAASVAFVPELPEKAFERVLAGASNALTGHGFVSEASVALRFQIGPGGQMTPLAGPPVSAPRTFSSKEGVNTLTIAPTGLVWANTSYVRWQPFVGEFERFVLPLVADFLATVSISAAKLEYWDRFIWSGTWDDFDVAKLIKADSPLIAHAAATAKKQWHSYAGWFDKEGDLRRLSNINVDIAELVVNPAVTPRASVGIYSSLTDQANVPGYGTQDASTLTGSFVIERLESQHIALKNMLSLIVTDEMASRIGLSSRKFAHAPN